MIEHDVPQSHQKAQIFMYFQGDAVNELLSYRHIQTYTLIQTDSHSSVLGH